MLRQKRFFDKHAENWDSYIESSDIKRIRKYIIPKLNIKNGEAILDIGSGTGILLPYLRKKAGKKAKIVAMDYSRGMIAVAKKKFGKDFEYVCGDAQKTKFKNNIFNKVVAFNVFPHFKNKLKLLKEMNRILKPGGALLVCHSDSREKINSFHRKIKGPVKHDRLPSKKAIKKMLLDAGYIKNSIKSKKQYYFLTATKPAP